MTNHDIQALRECWNAVFPYPISDRQLAIWLISHAPSIVRESIARAGLKYERLKGQMDNEYALRFASSVMIRLTAEAAEKGAA